MYSIVCWSIIFTMALIIVFQLKYRVGSQHQNKPTINIFVFRFLCLQIMVIWWLEILSNSFDIHF